jgi:hypothetical protein
MAKNASWSMKELHHAIRMKRQGASCAKIAVALGKSAAAVEAKLKPGGMAPLRLPAQRLIEAAATRVMAEPIRRDGAPHRDLTGAICGDPAIGCSALDRKRGGVAPIAGHDA